MSTGSDSIVTGFTLSNKQLECKFWYRDHVLSFRSEQIDEINEEKIAPVNHE